MIECIFTLDYEIYGNGAGALSDLVYEPTERLREIFQKWNARFVNFVEVAEFEKIEAYATDPAIEQVKRQIRDLHREGFEIGLHLHPQWCNATYSNRQWALDYSEYNLCTLPRPRIAEIVEHALEYLRSVLGQADFTPLSFRAGNWLFQPTATAASVLAEHGTRIDSSVFKGGLQRNHRLDYRSAPKRDRYWRFEGDVNQPHPAGAWMEFPIHSEMVPFWKMLTAKRLGFKNSYGGGTSQKSGGKLNRLLDFARLRYPLKLDFTRMTFQELSSMMNRVLGEDRKHPEQYWPVVAIGHSKDLVGAKTVDEFLAFLRNHGVAVGTFEDAYPKLMPERARPELRLARASEACK
jgi:hypothetical protein